MDNKTKGIIATVATVLLCGCPGLFICIFGILIAVGAPVTTTLNEQSSTQTFPPTYGFAMLCLSLIFIAIPIVVGFLTLRRKPAAPSNNEPIPPAA
jgi:uncharacterized membrane protein YidH (DUF202 family)